jgi:acyl-coenzyme A synthetase/AMP-(fatty) acid ligase
MTYLPLHRLLADGRAELHPVAVRGNEAIVFGQFRADVAAAAASLDGCEEAALACEDAYRFAVGFLALLHVGANIVLPPNSQPGALAELSIPVVDDTAVNEVALKQNAATERPFAPLDPTRHQIVFHTSGSTGAPKRVHKTLEMLSQESATIHRVWGERMGSGPVLATVSHRHLYGLAFRLLWPLAAARPFDADTDAVWESLLPKLRDNATVISSPAHLGRLAGIEPVACGLRPGIVFSAGAPLSFEAAVASREILGCLPTEIFGSTETGAMATRRQNLGDESWTLLPDTEFLLGRDGRMEVRSPYTGGWRQTEDLAAPVANGFRFLGRADTIVKIEGQRVSLPAVEAALAALPWIAEAAVVVLPGNPTRLGGLLVLTEPGRAHLAELGKFRFGRLLRASLTDTLEPPGLPRHWRFADSLPTRAMGKRGDAAIVALFA